ncbi:MAG: flavin reductase [Rhodospirillaceae bacterium]|nr:flavin reductase [Rhodospirillaceae bacterium]
MDADVKKSTLRMIPYGLYVMTACHGEEVAAATVNWVTQTSFDPPLVAVAVKADSGAYAVAKKAGAFALNMLGKGQQGAAFGFFKPAERDGDTINGEPFHTGETGAPVLENMPAAAECKLLEIVERGDHHIFVGEVVAVRQGKATEGRPDDAILHMKELGDNVFYGG